jgi:hypothetical protein
MQNEQFEQKRWLVGNDSEGNFSNGLLRDDHRRRRRRDGRHHLS